MGGHSSLKFKELFFSHQVHWGSPLEIINFYYFIKFIYLKIEEKLHQEKSQLFKMKDSKFGQMLAG